MIRIITDSTTDFTLEEIKQFNVDVVPLSVVFSDRSYKDRFELESKEFYELLENNEYPTTSQPAPSLFYDVYKKYENTGDEILVIGISAGLSGTIQSARIAAMDFKQRIEIIDSRLVSLCAQQVVLKAIKLRDEGKDLDTIIAEINRMIPKTRLVAGFDTLEYLVKGGRLSKVAGAAGTFLKIKPMLGIYDGLLKQITKTRGMKAMIQAIVEKMKESDIDKDELVILGYTKNPENALKLKEALETEGYKIDKMIEIGSVIGVHAGPLACAITFLEK